MKVILLALFVLLASAEGRKIGKRNGKQGGGKERSQETRRVFHIAETEENCGNYTELLTEEKPSDLCEEGSTTFCICVTRENIGEDKNNITEQQTWQFRCGTCQLKWSVDKDEQAEEQEEEKEKKVKKEKKKLTKSEKKRKEDRTKMRKKLKV